MSALLVKDNADFNRPYEKCLLYEASALTDAELLAVIIRSGVKGKSAVELSERVLAEAGNGDGLLALCRMSVADLVRIPGIGEVKAIQLTCIAELSRRIAARQARQALTFSDPSTVADYYMEQLRHDDQENVIAMMLDTKQHLVGEQRIYRGTVNSSIVSAREIFMAALGRRAVYVLLVHNHPSGDPTPSMEDLRMTKRVAEAGEILDIRLLDHIVIGDCCYISMAEAGILLNGKYHVQ